MTEAADKSLEAAINAAVDLVIMRDAGRAPSIELTQAASKFLLTIFDAASE